MTTEAISEETVFGLISTRAEITDWTTRKVLEALSIRDNNRNRKSCRAVLGALWKQGKIQRKATGKNDNLTSYCANSS